MLVCLYRALLTSVLIFTLSSCNFFHADPIKVGFIGTLSGPHSFLGTSARDGALLAVDEINQQGGITGRKVELIIRDDHNSQSNAKRAFSELVAEDVISIIGPMTSDIAASISDAATQNKVVIISPTVSTQDLADKDDYFIRIYPTAAEGTIKIAHFAFYERQLETFTVVYDMSSANFSLSWLENFKQDYVNVGGKVAAQIPFESQKRESSYQELAKRIKESGGQGILVLANPFATAMICQNLDKLNAKVDTYATEWSFGPDLIQYGGRNINKLMLFKTYFKDSSDNEAIAFAKNFEQQYGNAPWFSSAHAYDATRFLLSAIQKNDNKKSLKETLLNYGSFRGVQTEFSLTAHGDIIRPHYITRLDQDVEQFVAKLEKPVFSFF